jgi:hypothetical protein
MDWQDFWELIAWLCACYVFIGLTPISFALWKGSWWQIVGAIAAYVLNLVLLDYAKKRGWGKE